MNSVTFTWPPLFVILPTTLILVDQILKRVPPAQIDQIEDVLCTFNLMNEFGLLN